MDATGGMVTAAAGAGPTPAPRADADAWAAVSARSGFRI
jgi:hypothetical protein